MDPNSIVNLSDLNEGLSNLLPCHLVNNFTSDSEQCNFIIQNDCLEEDAFDYVYFVYCIMGTELRYLAIMNVVGLIVIFFLTLSVIADEFLCPSLLAIAKSLRISDNLAGITLLAFGNGCSDIFSSLAAASEGKAELLVSELLGAGIFCLSIVAGLILIKQDFRLAYRPLLRDTIFYLMSVYFIWLICWHQRITFYNALAFILIYVIYLTVALGGQAIHSHLRANHCDYFGRPKALVGERRNSRSSSARRRDLEDNGAGLQEVDDQTRKKEKEKINKNRKEGEQTTANLDWFVHNRGSMRKRRQSVLSITHRSPSPKRTHPHDMSSRLVGQLGGATTPAYGTISKHQLMGCAKEGISSIQVRANTVDGNPTGSVKLENSETNKMSSGRRHTEFLNLGFRPEDADLDGTTSDSTLEEEDAWKQIPLDDAGSDTKKDPKQQANQSSANEKTLANSGLSLRIGPCNESDSSNNKLEKQSMKCLVEEDWGSCFMLTGPSLDQDDEPELNDWDDLLAHINPIDVENWAQASIIRRLIIILRAPFLFVALTTVPVVDLDRKRANWCRLLNCFHCISIPLVILLNNRFNGNKSAPDVSEGFVQVILYYAPFLLLFLGIIASGYMLNSTQSHRPPRYHVLFAYLGFLMSILWVYLLVTEILGLLKTIGIIFSMTDTAIGLAFLAWGNSLGDIVANLALAEAGYPRMAIGASIGAPLLNLLIGFGLSFALSLAPGEVAPIRYTPTITLLCLTLAIIIMGLMLCSLLPPSYSKRPIGYLLISSYAIYFLLAVCLEFKLIKVK